MTLRTAGSTIGQVSVISPTIEPSIAGRTPQARSAATQNLGESTSRLDSYDFITSPMVWAFQRVAASVTIPALAIAILTEAVSDEA